MGQYQASCLFYAKIKWVWASWINAISKRPGGLWIHTTCIKLIAKCDYGPLIALWFCRVATHTLIDWNQERKNMELVPLRLKKGHCKYFDYRYYRWFLPWKIDSVSFFCDRSKNICKFLFLTNMLNLQKILSLSKTTSIHLLL